MSSFVMGAAVGFIAAYYVGRWQIRTALHRRRLFFDGYLHKIEPDPVWEFGRHWWRGDPDA